MNEAIVSAALKTLNIGDVSELTDEQITETVERINSLKVYDDTTLSELKSNVRKDFRTTIEGEVKGKAYEKIEKDILNKFGLELEKGTDYNTALELIEKAKINWVKESSNDETITKEMEALREKLKSVNEENESSLSDLKQAYKKQMSDLTLDGEISKYSSLIDAEDSLKVSQLEFLKYSFDKTYELREQDGQTVVFDKVKDEIVKNETDYSPETLSSVLGKLAPTIVKLKKDEAKQGRGVEGKPVAISNMAKFKTNEDFNQYLSGQDIRPTSIEGMKLYSEWKSTQ
tara:strand:+ start:469 stop:1329 length:861 start_codon:yes stop_codon:yes gene_type:complete